MDDIDLDNLTCLLDTRDDFSRPHELARCGAVHPDYDGFDPAAPLEPWPDDMTIDVVAFMSRFA
jgi:hypothetical protein